MTLARFQSTAVDTSGNVIAGASVTVRSQSTGNVVSIFSDRAGTVSLANPFTTDANGFFAFHVAGGTYRITISDGSTNSEITFVGVGRVQENEVIQVSSAGNVGIGTSSPGNNRLAVSSPTDTVQILGTDGTVEVAAAYCAASSIGYAGTLSNHRYTILSNNAERVTVAAAGNVGIGTSSPDASALLDVTSTTGGILFPRMTSTQRDAIGSPANGLVLYNTTTDKLQVRAGGSWVDLH